MAYRGCLANINSMMATPLKDVHSMLGPSYTWLIGCSSNASSMLDALLFGHSFHVMSKLQACVFGHSFHIKGLCFLDVPLKVTNGAFGRE